MFGTFAWYVGFGDATRLTEGYGPKRGLVMAADSSRARWMRSSSLSSVTDRLLLLDTWGDLSPLVTTGEMEWLMELYPFSDFRDADFQSGPPDVEDLWSDCSSVV